MVSSPAENVRYSVLASRPISNDIIVLSEDFEPSQVSFAWGRFVVETG
jgi:hypothetical protein